MTAPDFAFYTLAAVLLAAAVGVIAARQPVHAVLALVLVFFNAGGLFILLGAEFLAMVLVIVYVGAVMVLFLFVVMMLDVGPEGLRARGAAAIPLGLAVAGVLLAELGAVAAGYAALPSAAAAAHPVPEGVDNARALGQVLYTEYVYAFQGAGLVLLVAMVGAIVLTHRRRPGVRRQDVAAQIERRREDVIEVVKVTPRTGA
jgi:NADH-quinone oxidoreductase subunit J